jgi:hypothetical protein
MSTKTYLEVVNDVLTEMGEVELTSANFSSAVGVQKHVKNKVNKALQDMNTENYKWPFLATASSTDPHQGNTYVETVAGTRWYNLKTGTTGIDSDYGLVDWSSFIITTDGVAGETAPYLSEILRPTSIEEWRHKWAASEHEDESDTQQFGRPLRVLKSTDGRQLGLSPIPDKVYRIYFFAWDQMPSVSLHSDTFLFQDQFVETVLIPRVQYYGWRYKREGDLAEASKSEFDKGLRRMREILIQRNPDDTMKDDRMRYN